MRRVTVYLSDNLWKLLQLRSQEQRTSVSHLVREAIGEKFRVSNSDRKRAMQSLVGLWKTRRDLPAAETYVRRLRRSSSRLIDWKV